MRKTMLSEGPAAALSGTSVVGALAISVFSPESFGFACGCAGSSAGFAGASGACLAGGGGALSGPALACSCGGSSFAGFDGGDGAGFRSAGGASAIRLPDWSLGLDGALAGAFGDGWASRSEEHTSELQSLMRISYA